MFEQLVDGVRKVSESSIQMQQEMLKNFTRVLFQAPPSMPGAPGEWNKGSQKRWLELGVEMLHKHREALDSTYKTGIQIIEQTFNVGEAKSTDDVRRMSEEMWRKLFDLQKQQAETQFRDFQSLIEKSASLAQESTRS